MNPFKITERKFRDSDYAFFRDVIKKTMYDIISKYKTFNSKHFKESFEKTKKEMRLLVKGKSRVGFYLLRPEGKKLDITRIYITPRYQGKGIGTYYMKHFETLGYKRLTLEVWDNNPAKHLYRKLGYKTVKKHNHKIVMEKIIKR